MSLKQAQAIRQFDLTHRVQNSLSSASIGINCVSISQSNSNNSVSQHWNIRVLGGPKQDGDGGAEQRYGRGARDKVVGAAHHVAVLHAHARLALPSQPSLKPKLFLSNTMNMFREMNKFRLGIILSLQLPQTLKTRIFLLQNCNVHMQHVMRTPALRCPASRAWNQNCS